MGYVDELGPFQGWPFPWPLMFLSASLDARYDPEVLNRVLRTGYPTEVDRGRSKSKLPCLTRPRLTLRFIGPLMLAFCLPLSRLVLWLSRPFSFSCVGAGVVILASLPRSTLLSLSFPFFPPKIFELASTANGDVLPDALGSGGRRRWVSSTTVLLDFSTPCTILGGMGETLVGTSGMGSKCGRG